MYSVNFDEALKQARRVGIMFQFQEMANQLVDTYDYNDVMKAAEFAKKNVPKETKVSQERGINVVALLFNKTNEWLKTLPVKMLADTNCILFLWVTMPKLNECFDLIKNWGFKYKTCAFTWVKKNKRAPSWFWGMGRWTRANAELCLLSTCGHPKRISASVHSIIDTPIEQHSKKPDIVRDKIVELCGDIPRIELFARQRVNGWSCWGDEIQ